MAVKPFTNISHGGQECALCHIALGHRTRSHQVMAMRTDTQYYINIKNIIKERLLPLEVLNNNILYKYILIIFTYKAIIILYFVFITLVHLITFAIYVGKELTVLLNIIQTRPLQGLY